MANKLAFKPEWLYSENDLSKILNKPVPAIRSLIESKKIPVQHRLNRVVILGKTLNDYLKTKDVESIPNNQQMNLLKNDKIYTKYEAIQQVNVSEFKFNERYIREYGLTAISKDTNTGSTYYKGSDINRITKILLDTKLNIKVYPQLVVDNREYYTSQLTQILGVSHTTFKQIYIDTYHLEPKHIDKLKNRSQARIYYDGSEINRITHLIREDYYNE